MYIPTRKQDFIPGHYIYVRDRLAVVDRFDFPLVFWRWLQPPPTPVDANDTATSTSVNVNTDDDNEIDTAATDKDTDSAATNEANGTNTNTDGTTSEEKKTKSDTASNDANADASQAGGATSDDGGVINMVGVGLVNVNMNNNRSPTNNTGAFQPQEQQPVRHRSILHPKTMALFKVPVDDFPDIMSDDGEPDNSVDSVNHSAGARDSNSDR